MHSYLQEKGGVIYVILPYSLSGHWKIGGEGGWGRGGGCQKTGLDQIMIFCKFLKVYFKMRTACSSCDKDSKPWVGSPVFTRPGHLSSISHNRLASSFCILNSNQAFTTMLDVAVSAPSITKFSCMQLFCIGHLATIESPPSFHLST